jgi:hypothetical protein
MTTMRPVLVLVLVLVVVLSSYGDDCSSVRIAIPAPLPAPPRTTSDPPATPSTTSLSLSKWYLDLYHILRYATCSSGVVLRFL